MPLFKGGIDVGKGVANSLTSRVTHWFTEVSWEMTLFLSQLWSVLHDERCKVSDPCCLLRGEQVLMLFMPRGLEVS